MSVERVFEKAKTDALAKWRGWAEQIANGGKVPDMNEVAAAASALGITNAASELERDASALLEVRHLEQEAELVGHAIKDRLTVEGGPDAIRAKLAAARREVERLQRLVGTNPLHFKLSSLTGQARALRLSRPRVFPPVEKSKPRDGGKRTRKAVTA
jgi:hypothetical protein